MSRSECLVSSLPRLQSLRGPRQISSSMDITLNHVRKVRAASEAATSIRAICSDFDPTYSLMIDVPHIRILSSHTGSKQGFPTPSATFLRVAYHPANAQILRKHPLSATRNVGYSDMVIICHALSSTSTCSESRNYRFDKWLPPETVTNQDSTGRLKGDASLCGNALDAMKL